MIKKRARPNIRKREEEAEEETTTAATVQSTEEETIPIEDLIELRKFRRAREGIEVGKLNQGVAKKKKKAEDLASTTPSGLINVVEQEEDEAKARKAVRSNNFTQQTNALDVDKHMMEYIEENMKRRHGKRPGDDDDDEKPRDAQDDLFQLPEKYKAQQKTEAEEGNVTNSLAMLTAIPEVDLGMDTRLKNIEETEKAKRALAETSGPSRRKNHNDEEHLNSARFYKPNLRMKSDADILRDAQLEAMGLPPDDYEPRRHRDNQFTATDDIVMERFKKRMRK